MRLLGASVVLGTVGFVIACEEPPGCPSAIAEDTFAAAIHAYNGTIGAGTGSDFACPGGGSAHVSATSTSTGSNTRMIDVTVDFANCLDTDLPHIETLTRTGSFRYNGTQHLENTPSGSGYFCTSCTGHSDGLTMKGTVLLCNVSSVDATCPIDFQLTNSSATAFFTNATGSVCGLEFP
jgi:hypothetical protein